MLVLQKTRSLEYFCSYKTKNTYANDRTTNAGASQSDRPSYSPSSVLVKPNCVDVTKSGEVLLDSRSGDVLVQVKYSNRCDFRVEALPLKLQLPLELLSLFFFLPKDLSSPCVPLPVKCLTYHVHCIFSSSADSFCFLASAARMNCPRRCKISKESWDPQFNSW